MKVAGLGAGGVDRAMALDLARGLYGEPGIPPPQPMGGDEVSFGLVLRESKEGSVRSCYEVEEVEA